MSWDAICVHITKQIRNTFFQFKLYKRNICRSFDSYAKFKLPIFEAFTLIEIGSLWYKQSRKAKTKRTRSHHHRCEINLMQSGKKRMRETDIVWYAAFDSYSIIQFNWYLCLYGKPLNVLGSTTVRYSHYSVRTEMKNEKKLGLYLSFSSHSHSILLLCFLLQFAIFYSIREMEIN